METNSPKRLLSIVWKSVCQKGKKIVKTLSSLAAEMIILSLGFILTFVAGYLCYVAGCWAVSQYNKHFSSCDPDDCYYSDCVQGDIYFHNHYDGKGYIFNKKTGKKLLKNVTWIAEQDCYEDSLVCFSNGKKRGYFNVYTGEVAIKPVYDHAWIFSEGLAGVDDGGTIKFINTKGKVVIDNVSTYKEDMDDMVFHCGYCVIGSDNTEEERYGLMDKTGKMVLPFEYTSLSRENYYNMWIAKKGTTETTVFDEELKTVVTLEGNCDISIDDDFIDATMPDYTMRKYKLDGTLIHDFCISYIRMLEYEKDDIVYKSRPDRSDSYEEDEAYDEEDDYYHPKATARLRAYTAGYGKEGLMTADGHIVTMPLYDDIKAIGYDLYYCEWNEEGGVILNGKGETVR